MHETRIKLGRGITRNSFSWNVEEPLDEEFFFNAIGKFGISNDSLRKINPSYDDLLEIYSELKTFGISLKYFEKIRSLHQASYNN